MGIRKLVLKWVNVAISGIPQVFGTKAYKNMAVVGATIARTVATWHWLSDALTTRPDLIHYKKFISPCSVGVRLRTAIKHIFMNCNCGFLI
jgi:hypothetical protein